ncbi:peptidoglycan-binding domain-containing protein [Streptomyces sp. YIM S03343]
MPETTGHPCPECGAPRGAGNTPSCSCAERAAEALRDTRTAEAAAAEDFDPLRIRPYVELEGAAGPTPEGAAPAAPDATMPLNVVTPPDPAPDATMPLRVLTPPVPGPDANSVSMFDADATVGPGSGLGAGPDQPLDGFEAAPEPRRPRRTVLLVGSVVAVVAVVTGAAFASGVFSYDSPARDTAGSEVRAGVPETSASVSVPASSPDASSSASASESAAASPSASESASPSASASESASASASAPASASVTPSKTANGATASAQPQYGSGSAVLRRGDSGPEVVELQLRLKQLWLFAGDADGKFDSHLDDSVRSYQWTRGLKQDPKGVYGAETRAALERETSEP